MGNLLGGSNVSKNEKEKNDKLVSEKNIAMGMVGMIGREENMMKMARIYPIKLEGDKNSIDPNIAKDMEKRFGF